jgi:hypothetical protein
VLWATVSEQLRVTPKEIRDYFDVFAKLPNLKVRACVRACLPALWRGWVGVYIWVTYCLVCVSGPIELTD